MKIVVLEPLSIGVELLSEYSSELEEKGHEVIIYEDRVEDQCVITERAKDADIIVITNLPLSAEVINSCSSLKMISVAFTGVDHIDMEACRENDIMVSNSPGYSTDSVAELAVGMMLNLIRNVKDCDRAVRNGETRTGLIGNEIRGKKLGIVGTGSIGLRVAEIASVLGCELLGYNRTEKEKARNMGLKYVELETLFKESDIISIHLPYTAETEGLIGTELIESMSGNAIFINTARGPIVDSDALAAALNQGKIAGGGIDVFEVEPPIPAEHPLLNAKNTILTPHVAFATPEAFDKRADIVFKNIKKWIQGEAVNVVN